MLSNLLLNIRAENNTSGKSDLNGKSSQKGKLKSSGQVFKSLLKALQSNGESGEGKQALLTLSEDTTEGSSISKQILGGSFSEFNSDIEGEELQKSKEEILEELQKEFRDIKNQLLAEGKEKISKGQKNKKGDEKTDVKNSTSGESTTGDKKIVAGFSPKEDASKVGQMGKTEKEASGSKQIAKEASKNSNKSALSITSQDANPSSKGDGTIKSSWDDSSSAQQTKDESSNSQTQIKDVDKNIVADKASAQPASQEDEKKVANKGVQRVSSRAGNTKFEETAAKGPARFGSPEGGVNEKSATDKTKKVQKQLFFSNGTLQSQKRVDSQRNALKNVRSDASGAMPTDMAKKFESDREFKNNITFVKPLSGTISQSETAQTVITEFSEKQKKVMGTFGNKNNLTNLSAKGLEVKNPQAEKVQKEPKSKNNNEGKTTGFVSESSKERNELLKRLGISGAETQKKAKPFNFSGGSISVGESTTSFKEQVINWEEQVAQTLESGKEQESKASFGAGSARLGQMPIANVSLRKKILPGITQRIKQAASSAKHNTGNWQKHNFTLDDGKNIQLSVRESKGVLQVKMGSMNLDLSKLLQQNLQQIREHMRQEFGTDIDLQFDNQQQDEGAHHSDNTDSSDQKRNYRTNLSDKGLDAESLEDISSKTVRNFGYNQMEWTA